MERDYYEVLRVSKALQRIKKKLTRAGFKVSSIRIPETRKLRRVSRRQV